MNSYRFGGVLFVFYFVRIQIIGLVQRFKPWLLDTEMWFFWVLIRVTV